MCGIVEVFGRTDRGMVEAGLEVLSHRGSTDRSVTTKSGDPKGNRTYVDA